MCYPNFTTLNFVTIFMFMKKEEKNAQFDLHVDDSNICLISALRREFWFMITLYHGG